MSAEDYEKAYVVVRRDMSPGYQIVQSCHAVAEHEREHPGSMAGRTMIVLSVANLEDLRTVANRVNRANLQDEHAHPVTMFYEPDIGEHTAFASGPSVYWDEFVGLPLAGSS